MLYSKTSKSKKDTSNLASMGLTKQDDHADKMKSFAAKNHTSNANLRRDFAGDDAFMS